GVQPFEKLRTVGSDRLSLREVQMRVDKARQNEVRPMIGHLEIGASKLTDVSMIACVHHLAATHEDGTVLEVAIGGRVVDALRLGDEGQLPSADQEFTHWVVSPLTALSYHATKSLRSSSETWVTLAGGMACERPAFRQISR